MSENYGVKEQPDPIANNNPSIWDLVIEDMKSRNFKGIQTYGVPLQSFNGRNSVEDLYTELLDAVCYTRQFIEEKRIQDEQAQDTQTCCRCKTTNTNPSG